MVPVLYVLSVGPACYLFKTGRISEGTVVTAYYPIIWLAQENEMVGDWAGWYEALWSP
jgi:hypothetical protein